MRVPVGSSRLAAIIIGAALFGIAVEASVEDVPRVDELTRAEERFESQTFYCPAPSPITNPDGDVVEPAGGLLWTGAAASPVRVAFEPQEEETRELPASGMIGRVAFDRAVDVAGYDGSIGASASHSVATLGAGAAACSSVASDTWYFAQGSSLNGVIEHIVLYNPFPDSANVRVTTHRRDGDNVVASLADTEVAPRDSTVIDFTKALGPDPGELGITVEAERGRVVAWRSMTTRIEGQPVGVELTLGATRPATTLYLPSGTQTETTRTSVVLMNPSVNEAAVELSLLTGRRPLVPPGLGELAIPPGAARRVPLDVALEGQRIPETFSIVVDSNVPLVAERTIASSDVEGGRSGEVAATTTADSWLLLPLAQKTSNDRLIVMNPGSRSVDVEVTLGPVRGQPFVPDPLRVTIAGDRRVELPLGNWAGRSPFSALVSATGPVVAERSGYASGRGDLASAIGVPLTGGRDS